jgi:four helix bundle protein
MKSFEELEAWQISRKIVNQVYAITREGPLAKDFGLSSQLQRAAVSIMSNIAEGFERMHIPEKIQFYNTSRASCGEVRSLLYVVEDNYQVLTDRTACIKELVVQTGRLLSGLIQSTQNRKIGRS